MVCFYTQALSPHQLPWAREFVRLVGERNFRYICHHSVAGYRAGLGWSDKGDEKWIVNEYDNRAAARKQMLQCEVLITSVRDLSLMKARLKEGRPVLYMYERWFKPPLGMWRILMPSYMRMVLRFRRMSKSPFFRCLSIGPFAVSDMRRIGIPESKCISWGYFVRPSFRPFIPSAQKANQNLRLLWVGRMLGYKRVSDIIRAVAICSVGSRDRGNQSGLTLDLYGAGPQEAKLRRLVSKLRMGDRILFHSPVPIDEVRDLMHSHDVYVLSSDAQEGWGAVVSEALEEGMRVVGTFEAGSTATMLPRQNLYHAGDWQALAKILQRDVLRVDIGMWSAKAAAERLLNEIRRLLQSR